MKTFVKYETQQDHYNSRILAAACYTNQKGGGMITTTLDGTWKLRAVSPMKSSGIAQGSEWDMNVPGSLHDTLLANSLISEPYDGTEMARISWVGESAWSLKRSFMVEQKSKLTFLKCGSLSAATILINGRKAATKHDDSPLLLDAAEYIEEGENTIEILFSGQGTETEYEKMRFPGIWRSIKLISDPTLIIAGSEAETEHRKGRWYLDVIIPAIAGEDTEASFAITINGRTENGKLRIPKGNGEYLISIDPGDVSQWWPAGTGSQPIYPVTISINGYESTRNVAFRTASLLQDGLFVNGRRIFLKGAELGCTNLIPSRTDSAFLERLTRGASEANMNTLVLQTYARRSLRDAAIRNGLLLIDKGETGNIPKAISAPSFPSKETLTRIWNGDERNISSAAADLHGEGAGRIVSSIADSFLFPSEEGKIVYLSQIKAAKLASDRNASNRINDRHGMLLSSLTDPWPAISDSAIEYGGKWKLLQYAARSFYSPLAPLLIDDGKVISIYFVNDTLQKEEAEFSIKLRDFSGSKKDTREYSAVAEACSIVKVGEYPLHRIDRTRCFIYAKMSTKDILRERTMLLAKPKELKLEDPKLRTEVAKNGPRSFSIKILVEKPAFFVSLDTPEKGIFSDNMVTVRPSAEKTIFFRAEEDIQLETIRNGLHVMDMYTAMH